MHRLAAPLGALLVISSCGGAAEPAASAAPATRTQAAAQVWPLRGTKASGSEVRKRPLVVKVANDATSRPQTGLSQADLIIEIPVEGNITRYAVVFHSQDPSRVGPVRSARQSDLNYLATLKAILVHVGASQQVASMVRDAAKGGAFVDVDEFEHPTAFERTNDRPAPYNTFTSGAKARDAAGAKGRDEVDVPALAFDGAVKGSVATSDRAATTLTVPYVLAEQRVVYEYDGSSGYRRTQGGQRTTDGGKDVLPQNVVIIKTEVTEIPGTADATGAPSVDFRATGSGTVIVLRDGKRFDGTWTRRADEMYSFADASGATIALRPGLTWMHIVPASFDIP